MTIDHICLVVGDYQRSKSFFTQALAPLEIELVMEIKGQAGFGRADKPEFWIAEHAQKQYPMHIAFVAERRSQVDDFYKAALAAGGQDNGAPGVRDIYHPDYYGAFVLDPDGHNIEAVCHAAEA